MNEFPTVDDLFGVGQFYDGDKGKMPNGDSYWRFMIFKYFHLTYVLENHWNEREGGGWELEQVIKRLY
jgi:hypothetical protein